MLSYVFEVRNYKDENKSSGDDFNKPYFFDKWLCI